MSYDFSQISIEEVKELIFESFLKSAILIDNKEMSIYEHRLYSRNATNRIVDDLILKDKKQIGLINGTIIVSQDHKLYLGKPPYYLRFTGTDFEIWLKHPVVWILIGACDSTFATSHEKLMSIIGAAILNANIQREINEKCNKEQEYINLN